MPDLFQPVSLAGMTLRNRLMRSATAERRSEVDGTPRPDLAAMMAQLAGGGVGLIALGHTFVRPDGKASPGMAGLWRDDQVPAFARVAQAAKAKGAAIAVQINHGGRQANPSLTGGELIGPSAVALSEDAPAPRAVSEAEIAHLIEAYGQAARRVREAGFDAVQIHGAHGYLIGQFLSPQANQRQDQWGGSIENRARFLAAVAQRVRHYVGASYPVLVKLGLADFIAGGLVLEDGLAVVGMLQGMGIDMVELSGGAGGGNALTNISREDREAYFLSWARQARQRTGLPIALVGGFRSLGVMQSALNEGVAELVSLSRPLIREPDLASKLGSGTSTKARCISCNLCSKRSDAPTRCWVE